jgi:signal transduction histidine kinase
VAGIALGVVFIAAIIYAIVTRSVVDPIESVITATERVRAGDLEVSLPIISGDELGTLARSFNEMVGGLREREHLHRELRASRERIVAAADEERRRVERNIHDGAQQLLVLSQLKVGMLERDPGNAELVAEIRADLERALSELRDLAHGLYPPLLEAEGLVGALREAANRAGLPTSVDCDGAGRYRPEVEAAIYFCCLEALQNAGKHAGEGASATISLRHEEGSLRFEVADDGAGFHASNNGSGRGLQNMRDRIGALGGTVRIESAPGGGTTVAGQIPVAR